VSRHYFFYTIRKRAKHLKNEPEKQTSENYVPEEWKKRFGIFKEQSPGPDYISQIYYTIIKSLLYQARIGTAGNYQTSYNSRKAFRGNKRLCEITARFLKEY